MSDLDVPGQCQHSEQAGEGGERRRRTYQDPALRKAISDDTAVRAEQQAGQELQRDGEGWLSEETPDDLERLDRSRLWVVDPLDGTREFVEGVGEFCVSIALVEHGRPVAGGIFNPVTEEFFLGSAAAGVTYNGKPAKASQRSTLAGATILASRSESLQQSSQIGTVAIDPVLEFPVGPGCSQTHPLFLLQQPRHGRLRRVRLVVPPHRGDREAATIDIIHLHVDWAHPSFIKNVLYHAEGIILEMLVANGVI